MNAQLRAAQRQYENEAPPQDEETGIFADANAFAEFLVESPAVAERCHEILAEFACALYRDEYAVRKLERRFRELAYECIRDAEKSEAA